MDSGVDNSHQELNGFNKIVSGSYLTYQDRSPTTDEKRHGSHVSGIALGERDGSGIHGVAFDAQLFFISIELGTAGDTYEPATIDSTVDFTGIDNSWSQLEAEFVTNNVTVVNGSFGYQGNINDYTEQNIREAFPKTIDVLAQPQKANQDKTIFGLDSHIFNPYREVPKNQFLWGLTFGIGLHMCFGRDLDGGLVPDEKTDPSNHQYGIVTLLVQKILNEGGYPDDKNKPETDLSTERSNWASYPIIFGDKK